MTVMLCEAMSTLATTLALAAASGRQRAQIIKPKTASQRDARRETAARNMRVPQFGRRPPPGRGRNTAEDRTGDCRNHHYYFKLLLPQFESKLPSLWPYG